MTDYPHITAKKLELTQENKFIKVVVFYRRAGYNYTDYKRLASGFVVNVKPVTIEKHDDGFSFEVSLAFSGYNQELEQVDRYSKKRHDYWVKNLPPIVDEIIQTVLSKNGLELK